MFRRKMNNIDIQHENLSTNQEQDFLDKLEPKEKVFAIQSSTMYDYALVMNEGYDMMLKDVFKDMIGEKYSTSGLPYIRKNVESKLLRKLTQEQRVNAIQQSFLYDYANILNQGYDLAKNSDKVAEEDSKKNKYNDEEIKLIESIKEIDHPRSQDLYKFVTKYSINMDWYLENHESIKLVNYGIEILGDEFFLFDEKLEKSAKGTFTKYGHTYFDLESAIKHCKKNGRKLISEKDWEKYIDFLPGNDMNKVDFLINVLYLGKNGYSFPNDKSSLGFIEGRKRIGEYLIYGEKDNLSFCDDEDYWYRLSIHESNTNYGYSLRCLKNNNKNKKV